MNLALILNVLNKRRKIRHHESWNRSGLEAFQADSLKKLREFAYNKSPFYKKFHNGLMDRPLVELPVLTKLELMKHFDEVVTDPLIKVKDVQEHLKNLKGDELYLDRYRVNTTSGTTGMRGIFLFNSEEWAWVIASYSRAFEWGGIRAGLTHRVKMAVVSSRVPWHQSMRVGATVNSPWIPALRLDSLEPMPDMVRKLNEFQPDSLVAYAGMARDLAAEQLSGHLKIKPTSIYCASEVLTDESRKIIKRAWDVEPYDVYGATETSGIASECANHNGLHLYEDLVITEVVDDQYRPVPVGSFGTRVLVTVLFGRTLPLIRYEMTDCISLTPELCSCGLPFRMISGIEGRVEDVLKFCDTKKQLVNVHPNTFHNVLESAPITAWQVVQNPDGLTIFIVNPSLDYNLQNITMLIKKALYELGISEIKIDVRKLESIDRSSIGKRKLIVGLSQQSQNLPANGKSL